MFISFEGIDGAGKSSHIQAVVQQLRAAGREVLLTREIGGTAVAERIRELVLREPMDPVTEALLAFAARGDHVRQLIRPALERGITVVSDRFADSTFAYQGGGRRLDLEVLTRLEQWTVGACQPDLTLWFQVPPEEAARRRAAVRAADRFEAEDVAFFRAVHDAYEARRQAHPQRFEVIDSSRSPEEVRAQVQAVLLARGL